MAVEINAGLNLMDLLLKKRRLERHLPKTCTQSVKAARAYYSESARSADSRVCNRYPSVSDTGRALYKDRRNSLQAAVFGEPRNSVLGR
jgi:hypothetical protein